MSLPSTKKEAKELKSSKFFTGFPCKKGHLAERTTCDGKCTECRKEYKKAKHLEDPEKAKEDYRNRYHITKNFEGYAEKNRKRSAAWRKANPERFKEQMRLAAERNSVDRVKKAAAWAAANPEKMRAHRKEWKEANPEKVIAADAARRARELQAMPAWLSKEQKQEIEKIYLAARTLTLLTGVPHEVDHIVPLLGRIVCGLHVPWNLQVLPGKENRQKSNKF